MHSAAHRSLKGDKDKKQQPDALVCFNVYTDNLN